MKDEDRKYTEVLLPLIKKCRTDIHWAKDENGVPGCRRASFDYPLRLKHVNGGPAHGLCPMREGQNTTMVAVLDLDSHKDTGAPWPVMVATAQQLAAALLRRGVRPHAWRSSGGRGIHLIMLWAAPQDAYSVQALLWEVLRECGLGPGCGGVAAGEVEVFPKQTAIQPGKSGSMFVLPLAGQSVPLGDGWELLPKESVLEGYQWVDSEPVPFQVKPPPKPRPPAEIVDFQELQSALRAIPNGDTDSLSYRGEGAKEDGPIKGRVGWWDIIAAIHQATDGSEEGRALAHEFSAKSPKYVEEFLDDKVWCYLGFRQDGVTAKTIFKLAREHGWAGWPEWDRGAASPEDFEVLPGPEVVVDLSDCLPEPRAKGSSDGEPEDHSEWVEAPDDDETFIVHKAADLANDPAIQWRIKGVLPAEGLGALYGPPGSGKSFLALDMLGAVADGVPEWFGHRVIKTPTLYLAFEGQAGLAQRLRAYGLHHGYESGLDIITAPFDIRLKLGIYKLIHTVRKAYGLYREGERPLPWDGVLVVDTMSASAPGLEENEPGPIGQYLKAIKYIQRKLRGLVLLVHHTGKDASRGLRGHSSQAGAYDCIIEVDRINDTRGWTVVKGKDGPDGQSQSFRLEVVDLGFDGDGDPVSSCVIVPTEGGAVAPAAQRPVRGRNQKLVLEALQAAIATAEAPTGAGLPLLLPQGSRALPEAVAVGAAIEVLRSPELANFRLRARASEALSWLVRNNYIEMSDGWVWLRAENSTQ